MQQRAGAQSVPTLWGAAYAWSGFGLMWAVWVCFIIFLASPRGLRSWWPLPTVDFGGAALSPLWTGIIDVSLIALFGLQHSVMARPWFKLRVLGRMQPAFQRCTFVHCANLALLILVVFWQPIPAPVWHVDGWLAAVAWALFAAGWITLFMGAWSFGIFDLLGITQMRASVSGMNASPLGLKTGWMYRWLRHPMYVGVLLGVWATPRLSMGHLLLALGMTIYVMIAMRYEERDLLLAYGARYRAWRRARPMQSPVRI